MSDFRFVAGVPVGIAGVQPIFVGRASNCMG